MRLCSALLALFTSNRTHHGGAPPKARGMDAVLEQKLQQRLQLQDELPDVQHAVARARVSLCKVQCRHARVSQQALQVHSQDNDMLCNTIANQQLVCGQHTNGRKACSSSIATFCTVQADLSKWQQTAREKQFALDALQVSGNMQPMSGAAARAAVKNVS